MMNDTTKTAFKALCEVAKKNIRELEAAVDHYDGWETVNIRSALDRLSGISKGIESLRDHL